MKINKLRHDCPYCTPHVPGREFVKYECIWPDVHECEENFFDQCPKTELDEWMTIVNFTNNGHALEGFGGGCCCQPSRRECVNCF